MALAQLPGLQLEVYERNISALARQQPVECAQIDAVELTGDVTLAEGRDGTPTFRLRDGAGHQYWLGHSSMPATSSPAVLAEFMFGSGNVLLPTMGHGGEVKHLLARMAPHQAGWPMFLKTWGTRICRGSPERIAAGRRLADRMVVIDENPRLG